VLRESGASWDVLVRYGTGSGQEVAMSNCGVVAEADDGRMVMASLTSPDMVYSDDSGDSWSREERYWEDVNLDPDSSPTAYAMMALAVNADGEFVGAGSNIVQPPAFFMPTQVDAGKWWNFSRVVVDDYVQGEVWAMGTPGPGVWVVGGRDQGASSRASGFVYRSADGGASWSAVSLPAGIDIVHDIALDGDLGVAVGHRYPTSDGGFVLLTDDGGQSWTELDEAVPLLQSADIVGDTYWIAGDAYLARGTMD
jgi:hypothetical protein